MKKPVKIQMYTDARHAVDVSTCAGWLASIWVCWVHDDRRRFRSARVRRKPLHAMGHVLTMHIDDVLNGDGDSGAERLYRLAARRGRR